MALRQINPQRHARVKHLRAGALDDLHLRLARQSQVPVPQPLAAIPVALSQFQNSASRD